MSVSLLDGPLGIEALHRWQSADGFEITLNTHDTDPQVYVRKMPGFRSLPEADDNREPNTARTGETIYPSLIRGKTYTVEGEVRASSEQACRAWSTSLLASFGNERSQEGLMSHIPHPTYNGSMATAFWTSAARVLQLEIEEDVANLRQNLWLPYRQGFLLGLRMSDPRFYWSEVQTETGAGSVVATNDGYAPSEPTVVVTMASQDSLTISRGGDINLTLALCPAGTITFDFKYRTITDGSGNDLVGAIDQADRKWWFYGRAGLPLGAHTITQDNGTDLSVSWQHAMW